MWLLQCVGISFEQICMQFGLNLEAISGVNADQHFLSSVYQASAEICSQRGSCWTFKSSFLLVRLI